MSEADYDIHILNSLIKITLDSHKGFMDASEDAENTHFAAFFQDFAEGRLQAAATLRDEVRRIGGEPIDQGTLAAATHRTFMRLKEVFVSRDDKAIIEEVERGEDHIKSRFEEAFADDQLSADTRAVVVEAFRSVEAGHERASALKHSLAL